MSLPINAARGPAREPTQYASGYTLDLYCDQDHPFGSSDTFTGENWREAAAQARKIGWKIFTETRTARCPYCVSKRQSAQPSPSVAVNDREVASK